MHVRPDHPLRRFFAEVVRKHLEQSAGISDADVNEYIAGLLVDFAHVDNLYRIRNARGKRLEDVAEMLIESNPLLDAPSFFYERQVRKHIGDYTLFLTGLFPSMCIGCHSAECASMRLSITCRRARNRIELSRRSISSSFAVSRLCSGGCQSGLSFACSG